LAKILKGKISRGDIRWADLSAGVGHEQAGERPVLIISHDVFNERSGTVIALALTSQEQAAGFPLTHELLKSKLPKRSWVKISQVRTLSTARLGRKLGSVAPEEMDHIVDGLNEIIE
jgi:mRNA interferase MazF